MATASLFFGRHLMMPYLMPPTPFPRGRSGPMGFPCPPAPARHLMMPWYHFGRNSSPCCAAAAPNSDDVRGLCVLYVFAAATGLAKSTLLPLLILSRTAARTVARVRSVKVLHNSPRAMLLFGAPHCPIAFSSHKSLRKRVSGYVLTGLLLFGKTEQPEIHTAGESVDS